MNISFHFSPNYINHMRLYFVQLGTSSIVPACVTEVIHEGALLSVTAIFT